MWLFHVQIQYIKAAALWVNMVLKTFNSVAMVTKLILPEEHGILINSKGFC
jgi:hypothetical protein